MEENTSVFSQTDRANYHLSMKIDTDGDFGWEVVPTGFNYDFISGKFSFEKDFSSIQHAKEYVDSLTAQLSQFVKGRDYAVANFRLMLGCLRQSVHDGKEFYDTCDSNWTWTVTFSREYVPTAEEQLAIDTLKQCFSQGKVDASDILDMLNHCE